MKKLNIQFKLYGLRGLYAFFDWLANITNAHPYVVRKKIFLGVAILSLTLSLSLCTSPTDKAKNKNNKSSAVAEVTSTCYMPVAPLESVSQFNKKEVKKSRVHPKITSVAKKDTVMSEISCYIIGEEPKQYKLAENINDTLTFVEQIPSFKGGYDSMRQFIQNNLRYPAEMADIDVAGRVILQFTVTDKGDIVNIKVLRSLHHSFDNEAIRVVKLMPKWEPGKLDGKERNVRFTLPITFMMN